MPLKNKRNVGTARACQKGKRGYIRLPTFPLLASLVVKMTRIKKLSIIGGRAAQQDLAPSSQRHPPANRRRQGEPAQRTYAPRTFIHFNVDFGMGVQAGGVDRADHSLDRQIHFPSLFSAGSLPVVVLTRGVI